eukprot:4446612-Prymnesium_polylepis.1
MICLIDLLPHTGLWPSVASEPLMHPTYLFHDMHMSSLCRPMPQDAGDGCGGCWGRRQPAERSPKAQSGLLTPIFSD